VPYADKASRDKFGSKGVGDSSARNDYRGRDAGRDAQRQQAQSSLQSRGMDPAQGRSEMRNDPLRAIAPTKPRRAPAGTVVRRAPAASRSGARDRASGASDNALRGAGNAGATRQQADRGSASRASAGSHGGGARASHGGGGGRGGGRR
jgi:hypothetical protein